MDIVFDGPRGRFVEVESPPGVSISVGEWIQRDDGYWVLRMGGCLTANEGITRIKDAEAKLRDKFDKQCTSNAEIYYSIADTERNYHFWKQGYLLAQREGTHE